MRAEVATRLYVGSEVGTPRRVVLHRPDLALKRLAPRNREALLFDDVLWVRRARREHDAFADAVADRGVEVLYLEELPAAVLDAPEARRQVIDRTVAAVDLGPDLGPAVGAWLATIPAAELADRLIGGITYDELPFTSAALSAQVPALDGFVLAPLPNHLFTRDTSDGSMGPKAEAAAWFAETTGGRAAIGALRDAAEVLRGDRWTTVLAQVEVTSPA